MYEEEELTKEATVKNFLIVQHEGGRKVMVMLLSVGI
jgi:hypothetical protein